MRIKKPLIKLAKTKKNTYKNFSRKHRIGEVGLCIAGRMRLKRVCRKPDGQTSCVALVGHGRTS